MYYTILAVYVLYDGYSIILLLQDGVDALSAAAREGHCDIVQLLLSKGANVDIVSICIHVHVCILVIILLYSY